MQQQIHCRSHGFRLRSFVFIVFNLWCCARWSRWSKRPRLRDLIGSQRLTTPHRRVTAVVTFNSLSASFIEAISFLRQTTNLIQGSFFSELFHYPGCSRPWIAFHVSLLENFLGESVRCLFNYIWKTVNFLWRMLINMKLILTCKVVLIWNYPVHGWLITSCHVSLVRMFATNSMLNRLKCGVKSINVKVIHRWNI